MNRRLRKRHLRIVAGLALVLPVGLVAALSARAPIPKDMGAAPVIGLPEPTEPAISASERWGTTSIACRVWPQTEKRSAVVELRVEDEFAAPDLLLYWAASTGPRSSREPGETFLGEVFLIGSPVGSRTQRFALPTSPDSDALSGRLLLYSLAHNSVVATASLEKLGG